MIQTGCEGILSNIYDEPTERGTDIVTRDDTISGTLYVEANAWEAWYYVDLHAIREAVRRSHTGEAFDSACLHFEPYAVPRTLTGAWDGQSAIYTYMFRVLTGSGLDDNELLATEPTDAQPAPPTWDLAIHRNNVRTNGGSALETPYSSLSALPSTAQVLLDQLAKAGRDTTFTGDVWVETDVWVDQSTMLQETIPCQGIEVNEVLSRWTTMVIPPMPPSFRHNGNVFLLRMTDGSVAALRCANYISERNVKCCFTIEYIYPY